jgi:CheY-like chemotaxis protein
MMEWSADMAELQRVMCVEDDPDIRLILDFSIGKIGGLELCLCASGSQALACAPEFRPQLILLDVMMPGMSGPQTLENLRALDVTRQVPIYFLTAKAMPNEVEDLLACDAAGIIVKPFDPMALPESLHRYWAEHHAPSP